MSSSIIANSATIGENTKYGEFCVISENVTIGSGCKIGHGVKIHEGAQIGDNVRIDDNTVIGKFPMKAANSATTKEQELPVTKIASNCIIGTNVVIYRGCTIDNKVLVADLATVRENVTVGEFTIIGRGVTVENFCKIGRYCKLESNVYICAYCEIEDRVFVAPCVATSNDNYMGRSEERFKHFKGVTIKKGGRVGVNATILPGKVIGADSQIAGGALVTKDTPEGQIVVGVPGKVWREVSEDQLLKNQDWPE